MAKRIEFEIVAKVATGELDKLQKELADTLSGVGRLAGAGADLFKGDSKYLKSLNDELTRFGNIAGKSNIKALSNDKSIQRWGKQVENTFEGMTQAMIEGQREVGGISTRMRVLRGDVSKLVGLTRDLKMFAEDEPQKVKKMQQLTDQLAASRKRLDDIASRGKLDSDEYREASREVDQLARAYDAAEKDMESFFKRGQKAAQQAVMVSNSVDALKKDLGAKVGVGSKSDIEKTAKTMERLVTLSDEADDAIKTVSAQMTRFGADSLETAAAGRQFMSVLGDSVDQLKEYRNALKGSQQEQQRVAQNILKDVGSTRAAVKASSTAYDKQGEHLLQITALSTRYANSQVRLAQIEADATAALARGNVEMKERKVLSSQLGSLKSDLMSARNQLFAKEVNLDQEMLRYSKAIETATVKFNLLHKVRKNYERGSVDYNNTSDEMRRTIVEMDNYNAALVKNRQNQALVAQEITKTGAELQKVERRLDGIDSAFSTAFVNMKRTQEEQQRVVQNILKDVGSTRAAVKAATAEYHKQGDALTQITAITTEYSSIQSRLVQANNLATAAMSRGNVEIKERKALIAQLKAVESDLVRTQKQLSGRDSNLDQEMVEYARSLEEVKENITQLLIARRLLSRGTSEHRNVTEDVEREIKAYRTLETAMERNRQNSKLVGQGLADVGNDLTQVRTKLGNLDRAFDAMDSSVGNIKDMTSNIRQLTAMAAKLAESFGRGVVAGFAAAGTAMRRVGDAADSVFAGLQRAVQGTGNAFARFGSHVKSNMDKARDSMLAVTAAGYSLMSIGNQVQMFGNMAFRSMGRGMDEYMDYERTRIQAAIAATEISGEGASVDNALIDRIIFDMQSGGGRYSSDKMTFANGQPIPVTFNAKDLAQGMYYYSAAIGLPITEQSAETFMPTLQTIMQMAKVTNTDLETAIKGVMNIAMEFGYDPRDASQQEEIQKITAQTGYLANISTMEVTDIVEMFKMVGPMANLVAGGDKGDGLQDTFLMAFLASEVGLRGGNVGRGINQMFTGLLDPTAKMLTTMGKYFNETGEAFTAEEYKAEFFDGDKLEGGILGFVNKLVAQGMTGTDLGGMLSEMFTNNATRAALGPTIGLADGTVSLGGEEVPIQEFFARMEKDPFMWLGIAAAETANSVSGWFDYMKNSWFQFQSSIINSTKGSIMGAFKGIGDVLFSVAETINEFPAIGATIAAISSFIAAFASIAGTALIGAGAILIFSRTFVAMGGVVGLVIKTVVMAALSLGVLVPIFLLLAAAGAALHIAWKRDFMGMRTAYENFRSNFSMDTDLGDVMKRVMQRMAVFGRGFSELMDTIVFGTGSGLSNLSTTLNSLFGETLGQAILAKMVALRGELNLTDTVVGALFAKFSDRVGRVNLSLLTMQDIIRATQGFMTQLFMPGQMSGESVKAIYAIGDALGIVDGAFLDTVRNTANNFREIASIVAATAIIVYNSWKTAIGGIWDAIGNLVSALSGQDAMGAFGSLMEGVATGMANTFEIVGSIIESVLNSFAELTRTTQSVSGATITLNGHVFRLGDAFEMLGRAIGVALGVNLLMRFAPLMSVLTHLIPIVATLGAGILGLGGRLLVAAAGFAALILQGMATGAMLLVQSAAWAIKTGMTLSNTAATMANAAAHAMLSGTLTITGFAMAFVTTQMIALVATALMVVGILLAIVGALAVVAGAMLIAVTATDGWRAGLMGLVELLTGIVGGFMAIMVPVAAVVGFIYRFVDALTQAIGLGAGFRVIGVAIGVALGLIVVVIAALVIALGVLAVAWTAMWVAANLPIVLTMVAIAGIGIAIWGMVDIIRDALGQAEDRFGSLGLAVKLVFANIIEFIRDAMVTVVNAIGAGLNWVLEKAKTTFGDNVVTEAILGTGDGITPWEPEWGKDYKKDVETEIETFRRKDYTERVGVIVDPVVEGQGGLLRDILETIGLDDDADKIAIRLGIDLDNASVGEIQLIVQEMMKIPGAAQAIEGVDFGDAMMTQEEATKQVEAWEAYNAAIDKYIEQGMDRSEAVSRVQDEYVMMGKDIPKTPSAIAQMLAGHNEEIDEEVKKFEEMSEKWKAAAQEWYKADAEEMFGTLFDPFAGADNKSLISWMAGPGYEAVMKNVPEGTAPWMNETEFMADFAIGGGMDSAGEGVYGQNMHDLLRESGALDALSAQTGIPVDVLLIGVPKFQAPEEFQSVALVDMTRMLGDIRTKYGTEVANFLDTGFGTDILNASGQQATQFGMDWAEVNAYAIGKAIEGEDWNLVDYLVDSWGLSVDQANDYLASHGIDPNIINDDMYALTEQAALSGNGAFNVLTDEMYGWLRDATGNFSSMVIEMTEEEFAAMDDTTKAILTRMGYTFVVNDYVPREAIDKAKADVKALGDAIMSGIDSGEYVTWIEGTVAGMQGAVEDWTETSRYWDETAKQYMVTVEDVNGTVIVMPAAEYDAYMESLDAVQRVTAQFLENFWEGWRNATPQFEPMVGMGSGSIAETGMDYNAAGTGVGEPPTTNAALGVPDKLDVKIEFTVEDVPDADMSAALGIPLTEGAGTIKIKLVTEGFSEAGIAAQKIKDDLEDIVSSGGISLTANTSNLSEAADALSRISSAVGNLQGGKSFDITANTSNLSEAADAMQRILNGIVALGGGRVIEITANTTNLSEAATAIDTIKEGINGVIGYAGDVGGINLTVYTTLVDNGLESFYDDIQQLNEMMGGTTSKVYTVTLTTTAGEGSTDLGPMLDKLAGDTAFNIALTTSGFSEATDAATGLLDKVTSVATAHTVTIYTAGVSEAIEAIGVSLWNQITKVATTHTVTIWTSGISEGIGALAELLTAVQAVAKAWPVVVNVSVYGINEVATLLSMLNDLPNQKNVTVNTYRNEIVSQINNGVRNEATGGRIGSAGSKGTYAGSITGGVYTGQYASIVGRATGGRSQLGELTLVGEQGPELVGLSTGSFVMTARQTEKLYREGQAGQSTGFILATASREESGGVNIQNENTTINIYGDINIGDKDAADNFFMEIDRRSGSEMQMARRGMRPAGGFDS